MLSLKASKKLEYANLHYVQLSKHVMEKLGKPYNTCLKKSEILDHDQNLNIKETIRLDGNYNSINCKHFCKLLLFAKEFNCSLSHTLETGKLENCSSIGSINDYSSCIDACPEKCDLTSYRYNHEKISYTSVDSKDMMVFIYFDQLETRITSEYPKTSPSDVVAKIGGCLGLFVGMRLLSLIDILEYLLTVGFISWDRTWNKPSKVNRKN